MSISHYDDVIDSRDVIERIGVLEIEREDDGLTPNEAAELDALRALAEEAEQYAEDWRYGTTLIHESYFTEYCRDLVSDIGDIPANLPSYIEDNIDWDGVADDLKVGYTEVEFDGVTYLVR